MHDQRTQDNLTCTDCGYLLDGLDLSGCCPECGKRIINDCFWCEYDLSDTAPDSNCPECGVPVTASIGHGVLASVPIENLNRIHSGMRMVTTLILVYIVTSIAATVAMGVMLTSMNNTTIYLMVVTGSTINNGLLLLIAYGWLKVATPLPGVPERITAQDKRTFLRVMSWVFAGATALTLILNFIPSTFNTPNAVPGVIELAMGILSLSMLVIMLLYFISNVMYVGWLARLVGNKKMYGRSKHFVWSGPLIAILGALLLLLGPLIVLVMYWNMIEYTRRDLKKIISVAHQHRLARA